MTKRMVDALPPCRCSDEGRCTVATVTLRSGSHSPTARTAIYKTTTSPAFHPWLKLHYYSARKGASPHSQNASELRCIGCWMYDKSDIVHSCAAFRICLQVGWRQIFCQFAFRVRLTVNSDAVQFWNRRQKINQSVSKMAVGFNQ